MPATNKPSSNKQTIYLMGVAFDWDDPNAPLVNKHYILPASNVVMDSHEVLSSASSWVRSDFTRMPSTDATFNLTGGSQLYFSIDSEDQALDATIDFATINFRPAGSDDPGQGTVLYTPFTSRGTDESLRSGKNVFHAYPGQMLAGLQYSEGKSHFIPEPDFGLISPAGSQAFEFTIEFRVSAGGTTKYYKVDPEIIVSGGNR